MDEEFLSVELHIAGDLVAVERNDGIAPELMFYHIVAVWIVELEACFDPQLVRFLEDFDNSRVFWSEKDQVVDWTDCGHFPFLRNHAFVPQTTASVYRSWRKFR